MAMGFPADRLAYAHSIRVGHNAVRALVCAAILGHAGYKRGTRDCEVGGIRSLVGRGGDDQRFVSVRVSVPPSLAGLGRPKTIGCLFAKDSGVLADLCPGR